MRKNIIQFTISIWMFSIFILITGSAVAESRFEHEFREIAWGTHKDQLPDLGLSPGALNNIFSKGYSSALFMTNKGNFLMKLDDIPLLSIFLNFNDQYLYGADLVFDPKFREQIYKVIADEAGVDSFKDGIEDLWITRNITIRLTERELMITSNTFNPDQSNPARSSGAPLPDIPCCPAME